MQSDSKDFWQQFRRDVKPLKTSGRKKIKPAAKPRLVTGFSPAVTLDPNSKQRKQPERVDIALKPAISNGKQNSWQLDRGMVKNLRIGRVPLEARLDLHGLTQPEAHQALTKFMTMARRGSMRCVLVITGKSGVLKQEVPRWLRTPPLAEWIIGTETASPRHGGLGALYVVLKRAIKKPLESKS
jgi:DNA-nicking Smr family endonuclease